MKQGKDASSFLEKRSRWEFRIRSENEGISIMSVITTSSSEQTNSSLCWWAQEGHSLFCLPFQFFHLWGEGNDLLKACIMITRCRKWLSCNNFTIKQIRKWIFCSEPTAIYLFWSYTIFLLLFITGAKINFPSCYRKRHCYLKAAEVIPTW